MKKFILGTIAFVGITTLAIASVQANESESSKSTPCRKVMTNCPDGYGGGYTCNDDIPTFPSCIPSECYTVTECKPVGVGK